MDQLLVGPFFKIHGHTRNHVLETRRWITEEETLLSFESQLLTVYGCRSNHLFLLSGVSLLPSWTAFNAALLQSAPELTRCACTNVVERPSLDRWSSNFLSEQ